MAIGYNNLATAVDAAKDYHRAVGLVKASLEILESLQSAPDDIDDVSVLEYYATVFLINLGTIHINNGSYSVTSDKGHSERGQNLSTGQISQRRITFVYTLSPKRTKDKRLGSKCVLYSEVPQYAIFTIS